ncbi:uncharacterized protein ACA1_162350 [Acanthamoeba castellanii str. Neff]|uniref:Uncharacterized protein n=1 Tax=Acanthamoeba castellanii (strain ATCC 30010 / Neff) TaxID=1257118 RepID=L8GYK0_ACACF|nr:uncharacterized protein ACA1_162350 [Acanthamoeba castellanii str. Neff]ELR18060.1 hypothetical protein ACA1_162350 [Acanthamoeba castellanii str. Neff]
MRDTLEFEKKGKSVTPTTLRQSLKYADVADAAGANPNPIKRAGDAILESGIEQLLASLQPDHIKQVCAVTHTFGGDLAQLREAIVAQYLASGGGSLARFIEECPAPLQSAFQRVLRLKKNARDPVAHQITTGIVLLGTHHYFRQLPNLLKKEWCRDLGLKVSGTAAELEERLMWATHTESYPDPAVEPPGSGSDGDQPLTWADKIESALQQHGGEATLTEIYCAIEAEFPQDIVDKPNWQPAIRSCLSTNTSKGRFAVEETADGRKWSLSQG